MNEGRYFPIAGIAIAVLTGVTIVFAGGSFWLALIATLVWIASFWLASPPIPAPTDVPRGEDMKLSLARVAELFEYSGLPVLVLDGNRISVVNAAAREAIGKHLLGQDVRVALRHPAAIDLLSRQGAGSETIQGLTGPGSIWQMNRQPIDQRFSLIELINRAAEADISRAHTDFVANASHELRTPLASIIGYMETLVDEGEAVDPKVATRFHGTVLREARRLQSLVDDLMSLSRVEAEKHDQPRETVDLTLLVPQASRDGAGAERQERLDLQIAHERLLIRGDHQQLEQLIRNLVDNALKYGASGSDVAVSLAADASKDAVLIVRDSGDGISPEHIPHLTRRFYRTDPGRSRAVGGTGLGLAIVKHIVERHRGRLDIASCIGEGTTVTVRLPLMQPD